MNEIQQRTQNIQLECGVLAEQDIHKIMNILCFIRNTDDENERQRAEKMIHAFVIRKKLGESCNFRQLEEEFGFV